MNYRVKVTWTDEGQLGLPESVGTFLKWNRRAMYFDTMREADRFASQYLHNRTGYSMQTVELH